MKLHQKKFNEIKSVLQSKLGERIFVEKEQDTIFLTIIDSDLWLSVDDSEFTVGFGMNHTHFSEKYENLHEGFQEAFDLLTNEVRITEYIKGKTVYKVMTEIKISDSNIKNLGTTGILIYPFWKKTKIETSYFEKIIDQREIESKMNEILNMN